MVHPQLELEGTRIDTSGCYEGLRIKGHPVLLEQALINLIINANDAIRSHQGTCASHDGLITIGMAQRGSRALITITDNGTGFTPEVLPMVFEPFFTTKPPKGRPRRTTGFRRNGADATREGVAGMILPRILR